MPICWLTWAALNIYKKSLQWRNEELAIIRRLKWEQIYQLGLKYVAVVTRCPLVEVWLYFSFAVVLFLQESSAEFDTLVKGLQANITQLKESTPNETVSELQVLVRLWKRQILEVYNSQLISHVNLPRMYSYDVLRSPVTQQNNIFLYQTFPYSLFLVLFFLNRLFLTFKMLGSLHTACNLLFSQGRQAVWGETLEELKKPEISHLNHFAFMCKGTNARPDSKRKDRLQAI